MTATAVEVVGTTATAGTAAAAAGGTGSLLSMTATQVAARYGLTGAAVQTKVAPLFARGAALTRNPETVEAMLAYRDGALRILQKYARDGISPNGTAEQLRRLGLIEDLLPQWNVPF